MKVSIGICAYNEETNIGYLLERLKCYPFEQIVVASGCTDNTIQIVKSFNNVRLIEQKKREGKASAVNLLIENAIGDILILHGADILPSSICFKYLLEPFKDEQVGMVGGHPIPVDSVYSTIGRIAHLLWEVHHQSALLHAKAGEVCAFRNVITGIDPKTPVDEAYAEYELVRMGYKVVYAPKAIVFNKGAGNIKDFLNQRKRIYHGHLSLKDIGYSVPTMNSRNLIQAVKRATGKHYRTLAYTIALELEARRRAKQSYIHNGYSPTAWDMIKSSKEIK